MIVSAEQPVKNPLEDVADNDRRCPICGGPLIAVHCIARCMRCHNVIDTCCEGIGPNPMMAHSESTSAGAEDR
jgi:hypothetical protein